ncbi:MAG: SWIM zinc finger family protein [Saprospiraceae bacterium]|nr:SWIM zinc finger family protein [Saprospiraceae bacterium]
MYTLYKNDHLSIQKWIKELKEFQLDSMFDTNVLGRAYLYRNKVSIRSNQPDFISAEVNGSEPYAIELKSEADHIWAGCSCKYKGKCKHVAALLLVMMDNNL